MSAKAIYEHFGKELLYQNLTQSQVVRSPPVFITSNQSFEEVAAKHAWLSTAEKVVIKPDQLIKRRGKLGLVHLGSLDSVAAWFNKHKDAAQLVGTTNGHLRSFIIEPFVNIQPNNEKYVAIFSERDRDVILFHHEGGVDIGDVDAKANRLFVPVQVDDSLMVASQPDICKQLLGNVPKDAQPLLAEFISDLYRVYKELHFTYLEINPFVVQNEKIYILDLAAKLDETATFVCAERWRSRAGDKVTFPPPFGRDLAPAEQYIADLDAKTGASLKLTILNGMGRIWTMVAGGGASVIFTDTVCDLGGADELANYGEYSGDPSETQTYEYAKTILQLMTTGPVHPKGKVLIIGGSIANFTNVAKTFKGIVRALHEYKMQLHSHKVVIYVRRGGPNYQEGLRHMKETGQALGMPIHVFGPETHMTAVVSAALGNATMPQTEQQQPITTQFLLPTADYASSSWMQYPTSIPSVPFVQPEPAVKRPRADGKGRAPTPVTSVTPTVSRTGSRANVPSLDSGSGTDQLIHNGTKAIVWGQQLKAIQGMLDFDYVCRRTKPSVVASTYPLAGDHKQKYYFGHTEILVPAYKQMADVMRKHPDASVFVSFASMRSVYESTVEALSYPQIRVIAIIAEGVPENQTRRLIKLAAEKNVLFIGPATVGGIKPGCFKIGNTGGMMDNILASKLYRPGSVAYVSRSGGMSNELNNIICRNADGVQEGVAIGGDRYPGSVYVQHIQRYENDPTVKMIVMLGEVGGRLEYDVVQALQEGRIRKPLVAWCIGTCADHIKSEVQFGHAGASAQAEQETANSKNKALKAAGARVPDSFDDLGKTIKTLFDELRESGVIEPLEDKPPPPVPMDFAWARELGLIRKPASFMTSMVDERGDELLYAGTPISKVLESGMGVGGVLALLWFQRTLPRYAQKFIEMCLMLTADHGPAVSGAHNTIVCARAGKDLVSSLVSGLLTIGDRFGGALDGAANMFSEAFDTGLHPNQFVNKCRKEGKLIMGIGHRVKSLNNPDKRVEMLKKFASDKTQFTQATPLFDYALEVEQLTTAKKPNLILNVDGAIAVIFVDILRQSGSFTKEEAAEIIEIGALNGMFVLGRSLGFIGHYLDQKRLKQGLYRHPWDDITYVMPEMASGDPL